MQKKLGLPTDAVFQGKEVISMARYLPFKRELIATDEQVGERKSKFEKYDAYGIPYGILDDTYGEEKRNSVDKDRERARLLIMQGKKLPKDLEERLLKYKKNQ